MIRINLLPVKALKAEVSRRRELIVGGITLALAVVLLGGLYLYQSRELAGLEKEAADLRQEIQVLNAKVKDVAELEKKVKDFQSKHQVIQDLNKQKTGPVLVMESLSSAIPPSLWLTEFKESGGNLTMTGMAMDNQTIAEFLKALATISYFNNVELVETTQVEQEGMTLKKFAVRSSVSYQPPSMASGEKPEAKPATKDGKQG